MSAPASRKDAPDWVGSAAWFEDLAGRARRRFAKIDTLDADVRAVIHEYGWGPVNELIVAGVTDAKKLRHLCCYFRHEYGRVASLSGAA